MIRIPSLHFIEFNERLLKPFLNLSLTLIILHGAGLGRIMAERKV